MSRNFKLGTGKWFHKFPGVVGLFVGLFQLQQIHAAQLPAYTSLQAQTGEAIFKRHCARCHGAELQGGEFGPALLAAPFVRRWAGRPVGQLLSFIKEKMPPGAGGSLPDSEYLALVAYMLEAYGVQPGLTPLPRRLSALEAMELPAADALDPYIRDGGVALAQGVVLPKWPQKSNPAEVLTPISDEMLRTPPEGSWLSWRRTQDDGGFSPLRQITKENVKHLRLAWALALPPGPNEATPLAHDGVIFVNSYGDLIQALDAATGDEIWHYYWELPRRATPNVHRTIALYGDKLYFATSDAHVVALKAKSGELVWQQPVADFSKGFVTMGGPLIAEGVLMQGVGGIHGFIVGLDASSGKMLWKFNTIAQPGDPNGDSWNGVPLERRSGATVWTAGSFDFEDGLAFFGPAPTYDTEPLRKPISQVGITDDALYTDATVALDPRTGRLAWYYQHIPNDQWDLDWAFERQVVHLPISGKARRLVITAGKEAIYDALDASTGKFVFSLDLGVQNIVASINNETGVKSIRRELTPGDGKTVTVCPHEAGGKSWLPASYDPTRQTIYVPVVEACMDLVPTRKGHGFVTTDVFPFLRPLPGGDGKYGRLQAINLVTRSTIWVNRQRAPNTTGALATAGGIVFSGSLDRWFTAYGADTGVALWRVRLSDVPNAAPITYLANGKQFVAVVIGPGHGQTEAFLRLVPEIRPPATQSSAIWAFELSD